MNRTTALIALLLLGAPLRAYRAQEPQQLAASLRRSSGAALEKNCRLAEARGPGAISQLEPLLREEGAQWRALALRLISHIALKSSEREGERRKATAAVLALVRKSDLPLTERRDLLRLSGSIVSSRAGLAVIETQVASPEVRQSALFALARCPLPQTTHSLIRCLEAARDDRGRAAILSTLAGKRDAPAKTKLLTHWNDPHLPSREAARRGLARWGIPEALPLLKTAVARKEPGARDHLLEWLASVRAKGDAGDLPNAAKLYRSLLAENNSSPAQSCQSFLALMQLPGDAGEKNELAASLLERSSRPLRQCARAHLLPQGRTIVPLLIRSYDSGNSRGQLRAKTLNLLCEIDPEGARSRVLAAARSGPGRPEALALLAIFPGPKSEEILLLAMATHDRSLRQAAARALLSCVRKRIEDGERKEPRLLIQRGLSTVNDATLEGRYLSALAKVANRDSLPLLKTLKSPKENREAAASVRLAVARELLKIDPHHARAAAEDLLRNSRARPTRNGAARILIALGDPPETIAPRSGFLVSFAILGPLPPSERGTLTRHPFMESRPNQKRILRGRKGPVTWQTKAFSDLDGRIDLSFLKPSKQSCAYAYCELQWPKEERVEFRMGSDDQVAVWLNGTLVHKNWVSRGIRLDEDRFAATFARGRNRLLIKVNNGGGGWGFCIRPFRDTLPLDLRGAVTFPAP